MIFVDRREGSANLKTHLPECRVTTLESADAWFTGNGPKGELHIGVEIKQVHDALNCIMDGRFIEQLINMQEEYDRIYLIVERSYREDRQGYLEVASGIKWRIPKVGRKFRYREFVGWLASMEEFGGVRVRNSENRKQTASIIHALYQYWQKDYSKHRAHQALRTPDAVSSLVRPSLKRRVAALMPGVGLLKSGEAARHFDSIREMINANAEEWQEIEGIGPKIAERIIREVSR